MPDLPVQPKKDRAAAREVRERAYDLINESVLEIVGAQIKKAKGIRVQGPDGEIFLEPPDTKAATWLLERVWGKVPDLGDLAAAHTALTFESLVKQLVAERAALPAPAPLPPQTTDGEYREIAPAPGEVSNPQDAARERAARGLFG